MTRRFQQSLLEIHAKHTGTKYYPSRPLDRKPSRQVLRIARLRVNSTIDPKWTDCDRSMSSYRPECTVWPLGNPRGIKSFADDVKMEKQRVEKLTRKMLHVQRKHTGTLILAAWPLGIPRGIRSFADDVKMEKQRVEKLTRKMLHVQRKHTGTLIWPRDRWESLEGSDRSQMMSKWRSRGSKSSRERCSTSNGNTQEPWFGRVTAGNPSRDQIVRRWCQNGEAEGRKAHAKDAPRPTETHRNLDLAAWPLGIPRGIRSFADDVKMEKQRVEKLTRKMLHVQRKHTGTLIWPRDRWESLEGSDRSQMMSKWRSRGSKSSRERCSTSNGNTQEPWFGRVTAGNPSRDQIVRRWCQNGEAEGRKAHAKDAPRPTETHRNLDLAAWPLGIPRGIRSFADDVKMEKQRVEKLTRKMLHVQRKHTGTLIWPRDRWEIIEGSDRSQMMWRWRSRGSKSSRERCSTSNGNTQEPWFWPRDRSEIPRGIRSFADDVKMEKQRVEKLTRKMLHVQRKHTGTLILAAWPLGIPRGIRSFADDVKMEKQRVEKLTRKMLHVQRKHTGTLILDAWPLGNHRGIRSFADDVKMEKQRVEKTHEKDAARPTETHRNLNFGCWFSSTFCYYCIHSFANHNDRKI